MVFLERTLIYGIPFTKPAVKNGAHCPIWTSFGCWDAPAACPTPTLYFLAPRSTGGVACNEGVLHCCGRRCDIVGRTTGTGPAQRPPVTHGRTGLAGVIGSKLLCKVRVPARRMRGAIVPPFEPLPPFDTNLLATAFYLFAPVLINGWVNRTKGANAHGLGVGRGVGGGEGGRYHCGRSHFFSLLVEGIKLHLHVLWPPLAEKMCGQGHACRYP